MMASRTRLMGVTLLAVACFCVLRAVIAWGQGSALVDTDDVMRLVTAGDLLGGQRFQDATQYRDNTPWGIAGHWSRLIDLPVAGLLWLGRQVGLDPLKLAAIGWPMLLWVPLMAMSLLLCRRLAGNGAMPAGALLAALSTPILVEFGPGRVDHHNVQMLLVAALALALMAGRDSRIAAALAGLICATSLAVGLESLPQVLAAGMLAGLYAVVAPRAAKPMVAGFALALGSGSVLHFLIATPPGDYGVLWCDTLALPVMAAMLAGAAALLVLSVVAPLLATWPQRLVLAGVLAGAAGLGVMLGFPHCLAGPYGQDEAIAAMFPFIEEARPLLERVMAAPAAALSIAVPVMAGLVVAVWRCRRSTGAARRDWLVLAVLLAVSVAGMLAQIRAARLGAVLALPPGAWLVSEAWARFRNGNSPVAALGVVAAWLAFAGIALLTMLRPLEPWLPLQAERDSFTSGMRAVCTDPAAYAGLAALPQARIAAPSALGAPLLLYTGHSVVSAGYHRNREGQRDLDVLFGADEAAARAEARRRGITLFVSCPGLPAVEPWPWLEPMPPAGPLAVYRVLEP